jgi:hypothetical protein
MKYRFLLLAILAASALTSLAQNEKKAMPPVAAKTAFEKAFPAAGNVKWGKENAGYEANFSLKGKQMAAVYDNNGILKETEEDIKIIALPSPVTAYIKTHYANVAIKEAAKITKTGGEINYEAEVNKKDLIFDSNGKFIRQEKDED